MTTAKKISIIKKNIDKAWSLAVRRKFLRCIVCGSGKKIQAHHAIIRKSRNLKTRWMISNGVGLCFSCHKFRLHGQLGDKVFLDRYIEAVNNAIPADEQLNIIQLGSVPVIYTLSQLEDIKKEMEAA